MQDFHFPNWVNRFTLLILGGGAGLAVYVATVLFFATLPQTINLGHKPKQPVPFSHRIHAGLLQLDCRYCHNTVHDAAHAAIPPTATCGNCHGGNRVVDGRTLGVIWPENDTLEPVRSSLESAKYGEEAGDPVLWVRVHDLPDFVYFNHSAHINRGVACVSCHGRIDLMEIVEQKELLSMKWCLDCHRNPTPNIRDPELVTKMDFEPPNGDWSAYGEEWVEKLGIDPNTNCSTCHR
ncbi:MAG TPA: cytochrome c3 family protein [Pirellulaceae bacterium]|nr:cytochrome c3 family protein [Pirellulaceae bacterium]HMO92247.1 cytochrome c3 family protein [Pirellulaceae bacterium]HMP70064.1 cytochrome c3 family protein [Pirellulaceae bacterium]